MAFWLLQHFITDFLVQQPARDGGELFLFKSGEAHEVHADWSTPKVQHIVYCGRTQMGNHAGVKYMKLGYWSVIRVLC